MDELFAGCDNTVSINIQVQYGQLGKLHLPDIELEKVLKNMLKRMTRKVPYI